MTISLVGLLAIMLISFFIGYFAKPKTVSDDEKSLRQYEIDAKTDALKEIEKYKFDRRIEEFMNAYKKEQAKKND